MPWKQWRAGLTYTDCSTTFQGQDYKSHTSCISEAEKYQGALYKGPKKAGGHQGNNSKSATQTPAASTPADSPAPSEAGANGIHPSRLNQMGRPEQERGQFGGRGRGGFAQRGGRGGFRGGFQNSQGSWSATGENKLRPEGGMRQWGSAPPSDVEAASTAPGTPKAASTTAGGDNEEPKKKKRKGDKGGTGSKANSRVGNEDADESSSKKRKRDDDDSTPATEAAAPPSEKTVKRVKKHMKKLEDKVTGTVSLADWLQRVVDGKENKFGQSDVLQAVQVSLVDGHWQLSA